MSNLVSHRAYYTGRVQGVGFRYSVKQIAAGYELVGWVRNLDDGRVEVEMTGDRNEIRLFLEAIGSSHLATHIRETEHVELETPAGGVTGFEIRY